jgi:hypothetical protein
MSFSVADDAGSQGHLQVPKPAHQYNAEAFSRMDETAMKLFVSRRQAEKEKYKLPPSDAYILASAHFAGILPLVETFLFANHRTLSRAEAVFLFSSNPDVHCNCLSARLWLFTHGYTTWLRLSRKSKSKSMVGKATIPQIQVCPSNKEFPFRDLGVSKSVDRCNLEILRLKTHSVLLDFLVLRYIKCLTGVTN